MPSLGTTSESRFAKRNFTFATGLKQRIEVLYANEIDQNFLLSLLTRRSDIAVFHESLHLSGHHLISGGYSLFLVVRAKASPAVVLSVISSLNWCCMFHNDLDGAFSYQSTGKHVNCTRATEHVQGQRPNLSDSKFSAFVQIWREFSRSD